LKFENGTIQRIRSNSQRGLAACWARLAQNGLPSFDHFNPGPRVHDPKQLAVWKVEVNDAQLVFRALYRGSLLDEAFNEGWAGKTLTELTPPALRPLIISASDHCVSTGCAIYTILKTKAGAGLPVELERLLLPFGKNGRVRIILASLKLISPATADERRKAVENFKAQSDSVLAIRISGASFEELPSSPPARTELAGESPAS
jgi:hypothetical protein